MTPEEFLRVDELFQQACALPPEARAEFLNQQVEVSESVLREVEALLDQDLRLGTSSAATPFERGLAEQAAVLIGDRLNPGNEVGGYRIIERLGAGGMGVVYRAEQGYPRRQVALKIIQRELETPAARRRFEFEAEVLGRLHHSSIAQVYEAGVASMGDDRIPYFAMELVDGRPLNEHAKAEGLSVQERLELFARVCDAIHHAHQKGVIHRDLKPANLLVQRGSDRPGEPKILDFGVARLTESREERSTFRTQAGQLVGTLPYMSPEQVNGDPEAIDTRTDVFSLGVILYELLSGELPMDPGTAPIPEAARRILEEVPMRLGRRNPLLRGDIETIVAKSLAKEPERRYQSATELAADIRRTQRNEPISARPASRIYTLGKFARRNRGFVAATLLIVLALAGGFLAERIQRGAAERANTEARQANLELQQALDGAEKVTRFLTDLFAAANPRETAGRVVTVREKLVGVEAQLEQFAEQPAIEARIRTALGTACHGFGELQMAQEHLERAVAIREQLLGSEHGSTLHSKGVLASVLIGLNQSKSAGELAQEVYKAGLEHFGPEHEETLTALGILAMADEQAGRPEAENRYREVVKRSRAHLGPGHRQTLQATTNLGLWLQRRGRTQEAEPLLREVLELRQESLGEAHPDTAIALNNLGYLLNSSGRYEEAFDYLEAAYKLALDSLGSDHSRTQLFGNNLGVTYYALKRYEEARPFLEASVTTTTAKLGTHHPNTLMLRGNLATLQWKVGEVDEALASFPSIVEGLRSRLPEGHHATAAYERFFALVLMERQRYTEAEQLLLSAERAFQSSLGPGHQRTTQTYDSLIELYETWGKPDQAELWRRKAHP